METPYPILEHKAVMLAVRHEALVIGILGIVGGYTTPLLVSSGEPSPWIIFGYLTVLTVGVLGVAACCKWPSFNYSSFIANQLYICLWFISGDYDEYLGITMVFLIIIFGLYLGVASVYRVRDKTFLFNHQTALMIFTLCITGGIIYLYGRFVEKFKPIDKTAAAFFKGIGLVEIFVFITIQNSHFFSQKDYDLFLSPEQLSLSGLWMIYAIVLFIFGIKERTPYPFLY